MWSVVPPSQIGKLILLNELHDLVSTFRLVSTHTYNLHPQCAELVLNGGEIRHLFSAGNTVSGPEVQDHYATLESSHTLFDAREIFQREIDLLAMEFCRLTLGRTGRQYFESVYADYLGFFFVLEGAFDSDTFTNKLQPILSGQTKLAGCELIQLELVAIAHREQGRIAAFNARFRFQKIFSCAEFDLEAIGFSPTLSATNHLSFKLCACVLPVCRRSKRSDYNCECDNYLHFNVPVSRERNQARSDRLLAVTIKETAITRVAVSRECETRRARHGAGARKSRLPKQSQARSTPREPAVQVLPSLRL
jgi:hypothetical protein